MSIQGGCLCGKVRYEIASALQSADHCHCSMCRRQHGAAFATYADFKPTDFHWVSGEECITIFEPSPDGGWCFCRECGSSLAGTLDGDIVTIALGTVEGDPGVKPSFHIFVDSKASWDVISDELPQFGARPNEDEVP